MYLLLGSETINKYCSCCCNLRYENRLKKAFVTLEKRVGKISKPIQGGIYESVLPRTETISWKISKVKKREMTWKKDVELSYNKLLVQEQGVGTNSYISQMDWVRNWISVNITFISPLTWIKFWFNMKRSEDCWTSTFFSFTAIC